MLVAIGGLLATHARWLASGPRDPRFVRFLRRYDRRANAADFLPPHGTAVDHEGRTLDVAVEGSAFQHVLDDLSLSSGGRAAVQLSLDARLQERAEALMSGKRGAVVAIEPTTGRIRALVSAPRTASLDRALNGLYPPGSVFKVFVAAAALSADVDPVFDCPAGGYRSSRATPPIRDVEARQDRRWKGFGRMGMGEALVHSSNTYFAQLGVRLGTTLFSDAVAAAKLRDPAVVLSGTSVGLEASGCGVPDGLRPPELAPVAIGQGALQLTPLSVALLTSAVADDGLMLEPTLSPSARPRLRARPFTCSAAARVKKMMRAAVRQGTGRACDLPALSVCGKTGTAETGRGADHSWFTCFAPMDAPRLAVTVLVENGGFGACAALPVAREILLEADRQGLLE